MKKKYFPGILIILFIIAAYFLLNSYQCLVLKSMRFPSGVAKYLDNNTYKFVILYGKNLCGSCPVGTFLYNLSERKDVIYLVSDEFSVNDIENLEYTFNIKGQVKKGDIEVNAYLKKIASCVKADNIRNNFSLDLNKKKRIRGIEVF